MPSGKEVTDLGLPVFGAEAGPSPGKTKPSAPASAELSGSGGSKKDDPVPFTLGEGLSPVPSKLVIKILKGDFVDMTELLRDNIEAERRYARTQSFDIPSGSVPGRREVSDLFSWVQCFGVYAAVVASKNPEKVQQLLAYQTMVVREARHCGGKG